MILNDILYYAKFPAKAGVLKNFKRQDKIMPGYEELRTSVQALPEESLIPAIEDFIFSTNENIIKESISNIKSYFLMFQYGIIRSPAVNRAGARDTVFSSSLIVAKPISRNATDNVEEAIYLNQCLQYIVQIANQMRTDNKTLFCHADRFQESNIDISPIEPALLYGCTGWVMTFNRNKTALFD